MSSLRKPSAFPLNSALNPKICVKVPAKTTIVLATDKKVLQSETDLTAIKETVLSSISKATTIPKKKVATSDSPKPLISSTPIKSGPKSVISTSPMKPVRKPVVSSSPAKADSKFVITKRVPDSTMKPVVKPASLVSSTKTVASKLIPKTAEVKKSISSTTKVSSSISPSDKSLKISTPKKATTSAVESKTKPIEVPLQSIKSIFVSKPTVFAIKGSSNPPLSSETRKSVCKTPVTTKLSSTKSVGSKTTAKPSTLSRTPLKSSNTAKSGILTPTPVKSIRTRPGGVIKPLAGESKIKICDADSTTAVPVEYQVSEPVVVENKDQEPNINLDEKCMYVLAEQLSGVMQKHQLEETTGASHVEKSKLLDSDSFIIDMTAVEMEEGRVITSQDPLAKNSGEVFVCEDVQIDGKCTENCLENVKDNIESQCRTKVIQCFQNPYRVIECEPRVKVEENTESSCFVDIVSEDEPTVVEKTHENLEEIDDTSENVLEKDVSQDEVTSFSDSDGEKEISLMEDIPASNSEEEKGMNPIEDISLLILKEKNDYIPLSNLEKEKDLSLIEDIPFPNLEEENDQILVSSLEEGKDTSLTQDIPLHNLKEGNEHIPVYNLEREKDSSLIEDISLPNLEGENDQISVSSLEKGKETNLTQNIPLSNLKEENEHTPVSNLEEDNDHISVSNLEEGKDTSLIRDIPLPNLMKEENEHTPISNLEKEKDTSPTKDIPLPKIEYNEDVSQAAPSEVIECIDCLVEGVERVQIPVKNALPVIEEVEYENILNNKEFTRPTMATIIETDESGVTENARKILNHWFFGTDKSIEEIADTPTQPESVTPKVTDKCLVFETYGKLKDIEEHESVEQTVWENNEDRFELIDFLSSTNNYAVFQAGPCVELNDLQNYSGINEEVEELSTLFQTSNDQVINECTETGNLQDHFGSDIQIGKSYVNVERTICNNSIASNESMSYAEVVQCSTTNPEWQEPSSTCLEDGCTKKAQSSEKVECDEMAAKNIVKENNAPKVCSLYEIPEGEMVTVDENYEPSDHLQNEIDHHVDSKFHFKRTKRRNKKSRKHGAEENKYSQQCQDDMYSRPNGSRRQFHRYNQQSRRDHQPYYAAGHWKHCSENF